MGQNYRDEKILSVIEPIGYKQRSENYYVIREEDGYVNISYFKNISNITHINFHKNYYNGKYISDAENNNNFDNYVAFFRFLESYHPQYFRKEKLKKLNGK